MPWHTVTPRPASRFGHRRRRAPVPLDLVPRVIAAPEWDTIETGVVQRVRALEAFLADIYAKAEVIPTG